MPAVVRAPASRANGDCAIVALAAYLERSYEEVVEAAATVTGRKHRTVVHSGMWLREVRATAAVLGFTLRLRRRFDVTEDEGIIGLTTRTASPKGHVAYMKHGLLWGMVNDQWEVDAYCDYYKYQPVSLLELA